MRAACETDIGRLRVENQDAIFADERSGVLILADGMGGRAGGGVASSLAVGTIAASLKASPALDDGAAILCAIGEAITQANGAIRARAAEDPSLRGMGTTVVVAICGRDRIRIGHVGDSRAYLFGGGQLRQLTRDHSVVGELVENGALDRAALRTHRLRHMLSRSVGSQAKVKPDFVELEWKPGDRLLLCSDGLTNMLPDAVVEEQLRMKAGRLKRCCAELVKLANREGGKDNISAILAAPE